jgi:hypothetical protein
MYSDELDLTPPLVHRAGSKHIVQRAGGKHVVHRAGSIQSRVWTCGQAPQDTHHTLNLGIKNAPLLCNMQPFVSLLT